MNVQSSKSPATQLLAFIARLHFYVGIFVGPFIFIAALTGTFYVLTPQIEQRLYHHELTTPNRGEFHTLAEQIRAARESLPHDLQLKAVRPSTGEGYTTRVMFIDPALHGYESQTVFVDPVTLAVRGKLASYGTSGILPLRIKLDYLHQNMMLGQWGRVYSELAASWLWIAASGGLILWWTTRQRQKRMKQRSYNRNVYVRHRRRHVQAGLVIALGLFFISATGLTWSKWAGSHIAQWRQAIGWVTPSVSRNLPGYESAMSGGHHDHADHHAKPQDTTDVNHALDAQFDGVLLAARQAGIDAAKLEIVPARTPTKAWLVREIDRAWPTQVDSVAVDAQRMIVTSRADFAHFPLIAKLIRWGIDAHMGVLFGLPNQLLLAAFGLTLCMMVIWGYRMWWKRRPAAGSPVQTLLQTWLAMPVLYRTLAMMIAVLLGLAMPVMGVSLLFFVVIDVLRWWRAGQVVKTSSASS
ncbi:PepSY-associated TM helix domain-containing protein [Vibrio sp. MEBiC08052]|uniref:PepSY-associated TM helix domain-containing protein n=1 Tax=Vibrio sp. MEBiC08052 TaxID=1761910 RepID=UPI0007405810|nr:PepSY-associated TM helix domain-containing protein [Vibrio sp. MEBiC08052]KUI98738.1 PepSY-associated TM helix domain-containing protein [Vibrio sp. MEBiC08052]